MKGNCCMFVTLNHCSCQSWPFRISILFPQHYIQPSQHLAFCKCKRDALSISTQVSGIKPTWNRAKDVLGSGTHGFTCSLELHICRSSYLKTTWHERKPLKVHTTWAVIFPDWSHPLLTLASHPHRHLGVSNKGLIKIKQLFELLFTAVRRQRLKESDSRQLGVIKDKTKTRVARIWALTDSFQQRASTRSHRTVRSKYFLSIAESKAILGNPGLWALLD